MGSKEKIHFITFGSTNAFSNMTQISAKVPEHLEPIFEKAEEYVRNYFSSQVNNTNKGSIIIGGERYILVRAASLSHHFFEFIRNMYPGLEERESIVAASSVLYDIAKSIGSADAKAFHKKMNVTDPISKLSSGPIHFAFAGWAFVDIIKESNPSPDQNYYLLYDHPQSFEADSWLSLGKETDFCVCFMNAGYSTGWCEASFGIELKATELLCRARNDKFCRFIMAPPDRIDEYVKKYRMDFPELF